MKSERVGASPRNTHLGSYFVQTEVYWAFRDRVFRILAQREARMRVGQGELKGTALIGPSGAGKSRMAREIIAEYHAIAEARGDRQYGTRILSVIVPGRATVKEILKEILVALGYPLKSSRDEDYLARTVLNHMKDNGIAALHLDEVQDCGRYKTNESLEVFLKRFRNFMQDSEWPVCLIMTSTPEGRALLNHDPTFLRRFRPIEIKPMIFAKDGAVLRKALKRLFSDAKVEDAGILAHDEFIRILMHASVGRFGVAIEMAIEAVGECWNDGEQKVDMGYFADAYATRMDCDEDLNPFVAKNWKTIDTHNALQRFEEDPRQRRRRPKAL